MPFRKTIVTLLSTLFIAACGSSAGSSATPPSPDTWATVNGREIRRDDVEKAYRRVAPAPTGQTLSEEETLTAKLSLLSELILQEILVGRALESKLEVTDAELESAFAERKKNMAEGAFQQEMSQRGLTADDMKAGLRRELAAQKVVDRDVVSKISVTEQEISDFFTANRAQFNLPEPAYHIAQIIITPTKDEGINNRAGDDATTPAAAAAKATLIMERLKSGTSFQELAATFSEDPQTAPRGGDLGFIPTSALKQGPPILRDAVLKATVGKVTQISQGGAHTLMLLVATEAAGQRDLTVPAVKDGITATLRGRKEGLLRAAYLTAARNDATVVNYLARRLVDAQGKPLSLLPTK